MLPGVLSPHRVRALLLDPGVSERLWAQAFYYFFFGSDTDPLTANDVWRLIHRRSDSLHDELYELLARLPSTPDAEATLLDELCTSRVCTFGQYCALLRVNLATAERWLGDHRFVSYAAPCAVEGIQGLVKLCASGFDGVWAQFVDFARVQDAVNCAPEDSVRREIELRRELFVAALQHRRERARSAANAVFEASRERGSMLEVFSFQLIDHAATPATVERLMELLADNRTPRFLDLVRALVRVGSLDVIDRIVAGYRAGNGAVRQAAPSVLTNIRRPESERALINLLRIETNVERRTGLADALCQQFTTEGLEDVLRLLLSGAWNERFVELDQVFFAAAEAANYEPPELDIVRECSRALERSLLANEQRDPSDQNPISWN